ncbi:MAG: hypothetical protein J5I92_15185 [Thiogranum sp.]|nr:hypothetical protein [Thiogranum sp.]
MNGFRIARFLFVCASVLSLNGCPRPYAVRVADINEDRFSKTSRDHFADVQMSYPTIFARETLINDRRDEDTYLHQKLQESKDVRFESELRRELLNISALSARLGLAYDESAREQYLQELALSRSAQQLNLTRLRAAAAQTQLQEGFESDRLEQTQAVNALKAEREEELLRNQLAQAQLQDQITLKKLRFELMRQQYETDRLRSQINANRGKTNKSASPSENDATGASEPTAVATTDSVLEPLPEYSSTAPTVPAPSAANGSGLSMLTDPTLLTRDLQSINITSANYTDVLAQLNTKLSGLIDLLASSSIAPARDVEVNISPEADFSARQAYRRTIRSSIAENNLDDLHDKGGNSLFRMQFSATVLPGQKKDKWAAVRYTINSPPVDQSSVTKLYLEWLAHLTYRLNERETAKSASNRNSLGDVRYELLGAGTGLFDIARVYFSLTEPTSFDPCRRSSGTRIAFENMCGSVVLAVPPGSGSLVSAGLTGLEDVFLTAIVRRTERLDIHDENHRKELDDFFRFDRDVSDGYCSAGIQDVNTDTYDKLTRATGWHDILSIVQNVNGPVSKSVTAQLDRIIKANNVSPLDALNQLDLPPEKQSQVERHYQIEHLLKLIEENKVTEQEAANRAATILSDMNLQSLKRLYPPKKAFNIATQYQLLAPAVSKAAEGAMRRANLGKNQRAMLNRAIEDFEVTSNASRRLLRLWASHNATGGNQGDMVLPSCRIGHGRSPKSLTLASLQAQSIPLPPPPDDFCRAVIKDENSCDKLFREGFSGSFTFDGDAHAYATAPGVRTQRISTIASAADAFEFGLALAAKTPSSGLSADGGIGLARTAAGKIQARENAPIVVGFSGSHTDAVAHAANPSGSIQVPHFGWIFGPKLQLNPETNQLELRQELSRQDVTADISAPGWWPHIELKLESAWVGNWHSEGVIVLSPSHVTPIPVQLTHTRSDFDGLTNFISKQLLGKTLQVTHIAHVEPPNVTICRNNARVLIYGANVWRSTEVYLDGISATEGSIRVLPDMEGIEATFVTSDLKHRANGSNTVNLVVWTRDGSDEYPLPITGIFAEDACVDTAAPKPRQPQFALESIVPNKLPSCLSGDVTFVANIRDLPLKTDAKYLESSQEPYNVRLGGNTYPAYVIHTYEKENINEKSKSKSAYTVLKFNANNLSLSNWQGLHKIPFVVVGKNGLVTTDIEIITDPNQCKDANSSDAVSYEPGEIAMSSTFGDNTMDVCQKIASITLSRQKGGMDKIAYVEWLGIQATTSHNPGNQSAFVSFTNLPVLTAAPTGTMSLRLLNANRKQIHSIAVKPICSAP